MNEINKKYHTLDSFSNSFKNGKPFPHIVLDDFLDQKYFSFLKNYFDESPINNFDGNRFDSNAEKKKWISLNTNLPKEIYKIVETLNDELWISN